MGIELDNLVTKQIDYLRGTALDKLESEVLEQTRSYPQSYDDYADLPLNMRLGQAFGMFAQQTPNALSYSPKMPADVFTFSIGQLASVKSGLPHIRVEAEVAYFDGHWHPTVANSDPALKVHIKSTLSSFSDRTTGAELGRIVAKAPKLALDSGLQGFQVKDVSYEAYDGRGRVVTDAEESLFSDLIRIVDCGIEQLYWRRLNSRIDQLGKLSLDM